MTFVHDSSVFRLMNTYKKIHRFMNVIEFFAMRQWVWSRDNLVNLWEDLSKQDKEMFFFDMNQLDWDLFLQHYLRGIRQYLLNDPLETIPEALVRWNRFVDRARSIFMNVPNCCILISDCIGYIKALKHSLLL